MKDSRKEDSSLRKTRLRSNRIFIMASVLVCMTLFSFYLLGNIYARYTSESEGSDSARVAAFVFTAKSDKNQSMLLDLSDVKKPGDSKSIEIHVSNAENEYSQVSEVAENYTCTLNLLGDMPLKCELTPKDSSSPAVTVDARGTKTEGCTDQLAAGQFQRDEYILNVFWPSERNSADYADYAAGEYVSWLEIEIVCKQID